MNNTKQFLESLYSEDLYLVSIKTKVVITQPWNAMTKAEKEQLSKIADALRDKINPKLKLDAFEIVHAETLDLSKWSERPDKLIYFGPTLKGLNNYEVIEARGTKMVLSDTLGHLISSEASRTKLWSALKQLFAD